VCVRDFCKFWFPLTTGFPIAQWPSVLSLFNSWVIWNNNKFELETCQERKSNLLLFWNKTCAFTILLHCLKLVILLVLVFIFPYAMYISVDKTNARVYQKIIFSCLSFTNIIISGKVRKMLSWGLVFINSGNKKKMHNIDTYSESVHKTQPLTYVSECFCFSHGNGLLIWTISLFWKEEAKHMDHMFVEGTISFKMTNYTWCWSAIMSS